MAHRGAVDDKDHVGRVVQGQAKAPQFLFVVLALRNVANRSGEHRSRPRLDGHDGELDRKLRAICPQRVKLEGLAENRALAGGEVIGETLAVRVAKARRYWRLGNRLAERPISPVTED